MDFPNFSDDSNGTSSGNSPNFSGNSNETFPENFSDSSFTELSVEEVFTKYKDTVYRVAFVRTGNRTDAEDVTGDVFMKYVKFAGNSSGNSSDGGRTKKFESEEHRKAWLIRITINTAKSLLTSAWHRHSGGEIPETLADEKSGEYGKAETRQIVTAAVISLPAKYKDVIHLFYYEDLPTEKIAKILGKPENTVKSLLRRGRVMLMKELGGKEAFHD
ncbi:hypothetical protein FACS189499_02210 [Clostridia bacterium]|nr:hypothetical protein FACS189499_02210 [Clostridia bacterium]